MSARVLRFALLLGVAELGVAVLAGGLRAQGFDGAPSVAEREVNSPNPRDLTTLEPRDVLDSAKVGPAGEDTPLPDAAKIREVIQRGMEWLVKNQNPNGSWGGPANPGPYDEFWSNVTTHEAWIEATTGLAVMTLREHPESKEALAAAARGLDFLIDIPPPRRPSDWDTDNTWGAVYGLEALATCLKAGEPKDEKRREAAMAAAAKLVDHLADYQTPNGGWGYYDFDSLAKRPSWATSFQTAAALSALITAREAGVEVKGRMTQRAIDALRRCRLANGAYSYSIDPIPELHSEYINNVKGSLSRIQSCNYALVRCGVNDVSRSDVLTGLDQFFEHHRFLDVARKKPVPHETYYYNSGYFYFFGHFYAARLLDLLDPADRARYAARLAREVVKTVEADGSMWDYYMASYGRPYGTAFGVSTLTRTLPER